MLAIITSPTCNPEGLLTTTVVLVLVLLVGDPVTKVIWAEVLESTLHNQEIRITKFQMLGF
jgi:hypothetical protein